MLSEVTAAREAKEKADAEKAAAGNGNGKGQTSSTNPKGKGDGKTTDTSSPDGKGPPLDPFETAAREVAIGGALAQGDTSGNLKDPEGDRHGVPQGKNKGGYSNPVLQAGVGIVSIAIGLGMKPKDFVKQVREAIGLGKPVVVTAVEETAARKLADELIAENGGQYAMAEASRKHEVIIPYAMGEKFTQGLGGKLQAHKILEKQAFEKVWDLEGEGLEKAVDKAPSIILTAEEHKVISNKLAKAWREKLKKIEERQPTKADLREIYEKVYEDKPHWLKAIESYLR